MYLYIALLTVGVSLEKQGILTQWPAPDPMGYSIASRHTLKYTLETKQMF